MIKHIVLAALTWPVWIVIRFAGILSGLVIVPIALLFRNESLVTDPARQVYPSRKIVHLPKWAWLWDNDAEGMMSWMDEWPEMCWNKNPDSFLSMFQWAAIRNPANNMRFVKGLACFIPNVTEHTFYGNANVDDKDWQNGKGWNFIYAKGAFPYFGFNWVGDKFYCQIGHKIEPKHFVDGFVDKAPDRKLWKGMTFRFNRRRDNSKYEVNQ